MAGKASVILIFLVIVVALAGCSGSVKLTPTAPSEIGVIRDILSDIPSGQNLSLIAFSRAYEIDPFYFQRDIFVMFPDGSKEFSIIKDPADDDYAAFSPNGRSISFVSNRSSSWYANHDVFKYSPWGGVKQLTDTAWEWDSSVTDWGPGYILAAQLNTVIGAPFDVVRIHAMDPWGAWHKFLDTGYVASYDPCVNSAGTMLVFCARPSGPGYFGSMELYLWRKGDAAPYQLTYFEHDPATPVYTRHPAFGTGVAENCIVFQTTYWDGQWDLGYLPLNDPGNPHPEFKEPWVVEGSESTADDLEPCIDPTGLWIAFSTNRDGNFEIYKTWNYYNPLDMMPPVPDTIRLTKTTEDEHNPDWSPYY